MRLVVLSVLAALAASSAFAQTPAAPAAPAAPKEDPAARAMIGELETFRDKSAFKLVGQVRALSFKAVDEKSFDFTVDPKKPYRLVGLCDEHCAGVDLAAEDANERDVARDFGADPVAMVDVPPGAAGTKLVATLFPGACEKDKCLAALALFEVLPQPARPAP